MRNVAGECDPGAAFRAVGVEIARGALLAAIAGDRAWTEMPFVRDGEHEEPTVTVAAAPSRLLHRRYRVDFTIFEAYCSC